jgi:hypothetical protein
MDLFSVWVIRPDLVLKKLAYSKGLISIRNISQYVSYILCNSLATQTNSDIVSGEEEFISYKSLSWEQIGLNMFRTFFCNR